MKNQTLSPKQVQSSIGILTSIFTELNKLHRLGKNHIKIAGEVAARAFFDDYVFSQFLPNVAKRKKYFHHILDYNLSPLHCKVFSQQSIANRKSKIGNRKSFCLPASSDL